MSGPRDSYKKVDLSNSNTSVPMAQSNRGRTSVTKPEKQESKCPICGNTFKQHCNMKYHLRNEHPKYLQKY